MATITQPITDQIIETSIVRAISNVCQTLMRENVSLLERRSDPLPPAPGQSAHIFGSVGFVGATNGIVYLCLPDDFGLYAATTILGMTPGEAAADNGAAIKDVVGEITNMTVGGFKNVLCDIGYPCKLTLPTIVRGNNLSVASIKGATRYVHVFDCKGHRIIADIQIKSD